MLHTNHTVGKVGKWFALHQRCLKWQQKKFAAVALLFIRQQRGEQHTQIIIRCPHANPLCLGRLGVVIDWRLVGHGKEHITQMRRAFLAEKRRTLGGFGKLHWVGYGQQMLHLVQFLVDVDESTLL